MLWRRRCQVIAPRREYKGRRQVSPTVHAMSRARPTSLLRTTSVQGAEEGGDRGKAGMRGWCGEDGAKGDSRGMQGPFRGSTGQTLGRVQNPKGGVRPLPTRKGPLLPRAVVAMFPVNFPCHLQPRPGGWVRVNSHTQPPLGVTQVKSQTNPTTPQKTQAFAICTIQPI